jgi:hypothetical protein
MERTKDRSLNSPTSPLEICLRNQAACKAYLDGDGEDKAGAWAGLCDWVMEECLILMEGQQ